MLIICTWIHRVLLGRFIHPIFSKNLGPPSLFSPSTFIGNFVSPHLFTGPHSNPAEHSWHLTVQSLQWNTKTIWGICSKLTKKTVEWHHFMSFPCFYLLSLNILHTLLFSFYCWVWVGKCQLQNIFKLYWKWNWYT